MMSAMLLAATTPNLANIAKPMADDVAVIDCAMTNSLFTYRDKKSFPYNRFAREVFHIKSWDIEPQSIGFGVLDDDQIIDNAYSVLAPSVERGKLRFSLSLMMTQLEIETTIARRGTAMLSGTEKLRHGDGEIHLTGTCTTWIKRAPGAPGRKKAS